MNSETNGNHQNESTKENCWENYTGINPKWWNKFDSQIRHQS